MKIQLDPAYPVLSIDHTRIQFGVSAKLEIELEHPWQGQIIGQLSTGVSEDLLPSLAQIMDTNEGELRDFIEKLAPVCTSEIRVPPEVSINVGDNVTPRSLAALEGALAEYGIRTKIGSSQDTASISILFSSWATAPHRYRELIFRDQPYLIVEMHPDHFTIGPLVRPGVTACGFCVQQHQRDLNPHWPTIQSQLMVRAEKAPPQALFYSAAALISQELLSGSENKPVRITEIRLHEEPFEVNSFQPHPACYCLSFSGSES